VTGQLASRSPSAGAVARTRPRVGCVGVGWIGRIRLAALAASGVVDVVAVLDPDPAARDSVAQLLPHAGLYDELDELLAAGLDGVVIATPSALHASQTAAALDAGAAVFCQKPLARTAAETRALIDAAERADRLLEVDLCYRQTRAARALRDALHRNQIGTVHAVDMVFHNAYGPDKPWFLRRSQSGGGCLIDLGTHVLDLALWLTGAASLTVDAAHLTRGGEPVDPSGEEVEDFALAQLHTDAGVAVRVACSWFLSAGRDCVFEATAYGTAGAVTMRNVDGSFYDFAADRHHGTTRSSLVVGPDEWGARAIRGWAGRLAHGARFDQRAWELETLATTIDDIYGRAACGC
jgi:predicted dehydrogenase